MVSKNDRLIQNTLPKRRTALLVQEIVELLQGQGVAVEPLLPAGPVGSRILDGHSAELSFRETAAFFERAAKATGNPDFGFSMGMHRDFRALGLAAYSAISASDLEEFLESFCRNLSCYSDAIEIQFLSHGKLIWNVDEPKQLHHRQYLECLLTLLIKSVRIFQEPRSGGQKILAKAVWLDFPHEGSGRKRSHFWGCQVTRNAGRFEIHFHPSDLARPLRTSDRYLHQMIEDYATRQRYEEAEQRQSLLYQLQSVILRDLGQKKLTQQTVARALGLSTRTFSRELNRQDLRFFVVLDDIRQNLARSYLCDSDMPPAEIAEALGYASLSSFNDAFRRWTMTSPGQFRRMIKRNERIENQPDQTK